jgi:hypothetical protein
VPGNHTIATCQEGETNLKIWKIYSCLQKLKEDFHTSTDGFTDCNVILCMGLFIFTGRENSTTDM